MPSGADFGLGPPSRCADRAGGRRPDGCRADAARASRATGQTAPAATCRLRRAPRNGEPAARPESARQYCVPEMWLVKGGLSWVPFNTEDEIWQGPDGRYTGLVGMFCRTPRCADCRKVLYGYKGPEPEKGGDWVDENWFHEEYWLQWDECAAREAA